MDQSTNIEQIKSLRRTKKKTDENQNLLHKRVKITRRQIESFRKFAGQKPGRIADYVNMLADTLESELQSN